MRTSVGPAKNPLPERQRIAQQDAKAQCFLRVFLFSGSKNLIKFGGFTDVFLLKYPMLRARKRHPVDGRPIPNNNVHLGNGKIKQFPAFFRLFL